uniref:Alpha-conotoxin-like n=1 Tax=Conus terebra TaxID=89453 RepID=S4UKB3_CONTC|nr:A superfamily conotoxin Tr1.1c precursor [Conus terebra]AGK23289.1 A superfamily conotoxin Tr1.1b precursor [Conus terebra]AGK23290.1 A superfamily conotoxin Tr1.1a precursor [Conus terebra]
MGMRMMFIVFLLVVFASSVTLDRASHGRYAAVVDRASALISQAILRDCCSNPPCAHNNPDCR